MENELYHHGILGQKWGERNGPPYPLSFSVKSIAEKRKMRKAQKKKEQNLEKARKAKAEKAEETRRTEAEEKLRLENKERVLREGNAEDVIAIKSQLSYQELKDAYNRLSTERDIKNLIEAKPVEPDFFDKLDSKKEKAEKLINVGKTLVSGYNFVVAISNSLSDNDGGHSFKDAKGKYKQIKYDTGGGGGNNKKKGN